MPLGSCTATSYRREVALDVERRGRGGDVVAWVVPVLESDPGRLAVSLSVKEDNKREFATLCRQSLRQLHSHDPTPKWLLVCLWNVRTGKEDGCWGFLSTAIQLRHPNVVFRGDCRLFSSPPPLLPKQWSWDAHILSLESPTDDPPLDWEERLPDAIIHKVGVMRVLTEERELFNRTHSSLLDGGFMDMRSSRVLLALGIATPRTESRVMEQRFLGPLRLELLGFLGNSESVHVSAPGVLKMLADGEISTPPCRGRVQLEPHILVRVLIETFRRDVCPGSVSVHNPSPSLFSALQFARDVLRPRVRAEAHPVEAVPRLGG